MSPVAEQSKTETPEVEHGIENACYSGGPGEPYYQPTIDCLCGWDSGRCESWEQAGRRFDEHLAEANPLRADTPDRRETEKGSGDKK